MMILLGPFGPKSMADALVASENVGDGGPGDVARFGDRARERRERARGMVWACGRRCRVDEEGLVVSAKRDVQAQRQDGVCSRARVVRIGGSR